MADAPWRCSQCGTVNEPNANSCRSCGRWPSLFDLEQNTVDAEPELDAEAEVEVEVEEATPYETGAPTEVQEAQVDVAPPDDQGRDSSGVPEKPAKWPGPENPLDRPTQGWPRVASWIVPILIVLYIVISALVDR